MINVTLSENGGRKALGKISVMFGPNGKNILNLQMKCT